MDKRKSNRDNARPAPAPVFSLCCSPLPGARVGKRVRMRAQNEWRKSSVEEERKEGEEEKREII